MLSNSWIIGIVSGFIATAIFNLIINLFTKKDYNNNIEKANSEVHDLLLLATIEEKMPNAAVISALLNSTAKKYTVRINDINSVDDVYDDLIRGIYKTNLLSFEKKQTITINLSDLKEQKYILKSENKLRDLYNIRELRRTKLFLYTYVVGLSLMFLVTYRDKLNGEFTLHAFGSLSESDKLLAGFVATYTVSFIMSRYFENRMHKKYRKSDEAT
ncbi:hypothetical protein [Virgibacillus kimchii]